MANETTLEQPVQVARQLPWSADGVGFQWEPGFAPSSCGRGVGASRPELERRVADGGIP